MSLARIPRAIWHDLRFYLLESLALVALMGITAAMFYAHRVAAVDSHFGLQIHQPFIEDFKEEVATWALAWWLIAAVPLIVVAARARGARSSEQSIRNILAKNQVQLLQAERLARIGYWQWNAGSERLFLSPQAAVMSGLREGAQQMSLAALSNPEISRDAHQYLSRVSHVMETGRTVRLDVRIATQRGAMWVHVIMQPARNARRKTIGVVGTLQDVSKRKKIENELRALKADYATLLDHLPATVCLMDKEGRILKVNELVLKQSGKTRGQIEGQMFGDVFPSYASERLADNLEVIRTEKPMLGLIESVPTRNNLPRWIQVDKVPSRDVDGRVNGVIVYAIDITRRKRAEEQLQALTAEREMLLNRIPAFVVYKDLKGCVVHANRMAAQLAGRSRESLIGLHGSKLFPSASADLIARTDEEVLRTRMPRLGIIAAVDLPDGNKQYFEIDVLPNLDENGEPKGLVVFGLDVTDRKRAEQRSDYLASHDPLTNAWNRRALCDRMEQTLEAARRQDRRLGLLFIDLDHFKAVNDAHGHDVGDELLVEVAKRLHTCLCFEDTSARTGGDEFVVIRAEITCAEDALQVAETIRAALAQPYFVRNLTLIISSSIGIATYPDDARAQHDLMRIADMAMYQAKAAGGNAIRAFDGSVCSRAKAR